MSKAKTEEFEPYSVDENFVPDLLSQTGIVHTDGYGDFQSHNHPIFAEAKRRQLIVARKALDPNDPTPSNLVVLPHQTTVVIGDPEGARDRVLAAAETVDPTGLVTSPDTERVDDAQLAAPGETDDPAA